jgi:catechol 2,3-dioxygenase-like lactoylglutathione lyase family enzyme
VLGRFHEIGIQTKDIRASVEFYERLGFSQAETGETWTHPYGVLTDGRIHLGLHQRSFDSPALTFVHADVARYATELAALGVKLAYQRTGEHEFHSIGLRDPNGQMVVVVEARTYSPVSRGPERTPLCGYFEE